MKHSRIFAVIRDVSGISAICAQANPSIVILLIFFVRSAGYRLYRATSHARQIESSVPGFSGHVALQITQLKVQGSLS